jgi:hypothetical protein
MGLYRYEKYLLWAGVGAAIMGASPNVNFAPQFLPFRILYGLGSIPYDIIASMVPYGDPVFYLQRSCFGGVEPAPWKIVYFTMSAALFWLGIRRVVLFRPKRPGPKSPFDEPEELGDAC